MINANFIIIDDDPISNMISKQIIREALPKADILVFTEPEAGLAHIFSTYPNPDANNTILFLDINMPTLSGWEVLDELNKLPDVVKAHFNIYMLSSSVDPRDKKKAGESPIILDCLVKPLTRRQVKTISD